MENEKTYEDLKPEYYEIYVDFINEYSDYGCTCHMGHPPCSYCTHEGNPRNLVETDDAWYPTIMPEDMFKL